MRLKNTVKRKRLQPGGMAGWRRLGWEGGWCPERKVAAACHFQNIPYRRACRKARALAQDRALLPEGSRSNARVAVDG